MPSVSLCPTLGAFYQSFTNGGLPNNVGYVYSYAAGNNTTPQATYTTSAGNVPCANPIVFDASGRTTTEIWVMNGVGYRFDLYDSLGNLIKTYDNIYGISNGIPSWLLIATNYYNDDGTQVGAIPNTQDDYTGLQRFFTACSGRAGYIPSLGTGNKYYYKTKLNIPVANGTNIQGSGIRATQMLFDPTVALSDAISSNNTWSTATNNISFGNLTVEGKSGNTNHRHGVSWIATNRSELPNLRCTGFVNNGCGGLYSEDSILVNFTGADMDGNYYPWVDNGGANSNPNGWVVSGRFENSTNIGGLLYGIFGSKLTIQVEGNYYGFTITTTGGGLDFGGSYFELNKHGSNVGYDLAIGTGSYVTGVNISGCHFDGGYGTNYWSVALNYAIAVRIDANRLHSHAYFLTFTGNNYSNCYFGTLGLGVGLSRVPGNAGTYANIDANTLSRGNVFADPTSFPSVAANLVDGDMPYGGFTFSTNGSGTWVVSPNTSNVPEKVNGRPVGLLTHTSGDTDSLTRSWPISGVLNPAVLGAWVTLKLNVFFANASQLQFLQTLDDAGAQVYTNTPSGTNATVSMPYYVSGYFSTSTTTLRALLNTFTAQGGTGIYKIADVGVYVGMNPANMPSLTGPPVFTGLSGIPTAGTTAVGDRFVRTPVAGQPKAWSTTVAGTIGSSATIVSEGNL